MKTKIFETILQWVPASKTWMDFEEAKDETLTQYILLKRTAHFCIEKMNAAEPEEVNMAREVMKVINMLYESGNHYTKNAIENEFFAELIAQENPASLKKHLDFLSKESREGYLKTILEN
ncbi:DUF7674 family protein [Flavobacterium tegetincola]|uniref:DUF7674 family protein n=1 Tax=Flavobacterium tegetincola TaxID=150172 RepID=UPI00040568EE|nr:hypothetical protein [Flavobacterium tegetincola]